MKQHIHAMEYYPATKRKAHAICYKIKKPDIKDYVWYNTIHRKSPEMENLWR